MKVAAGYLVRWLLSIAFWKDSCDEGGLAWDDSNNNRAFHAGEISATLNGASIYIVANWLHQKENYGRWFQVAEGPCTPHNVCSSQTFAYCKGRYLRSDSVSLRPSVTGAPIETHALFPPCTPCL
jgi:hypothetical protein